MPSSFASARGAFGRDRTRQQTSAPQPFNIADFAPAFFNFINNASGENPIAAVVVRDGDQEFVGAPGILTVDTTPAVPGEFISLFGTGFGPTNPSFEAGQIPLSVNPDAPTAPLTASNVRVLFGAIEVAPEDIFYVGVAPCCAGLYQLVVKVPDNAPDGDLPVVIIIDGVSSPEGPFITVAAPG